MFVGGRKLAANARTPFVNIAINLLFQFSAQGDTPRIRLIGAFHRFAVVIHLLGEFGGDSVGREVVRLAPVERDEEVRATDSAS